MNLYPSAWGSISAATFKILLACGRGCSVDRTTTDALALLVRFFVSVLYQLLLPRLLELP